MSHVLSTYARFPVTLVRGEGTRVWDDTGKSYLDFCTGIAVCALGHCPPRLVNAIREQAGTLLHVSNLYGIPQQEELARVIVEDHVKIPGKVFFANSGAESNDGLIKTARKFGHTRPQPDGSPRYEVLSFTKSFHGRTLGGINATGQDKVKEGFDPPLPGFRHLPFNDLAALEAAISPITAAILLEPIQGEGGVNVATPEFLGGVAALCKKHDLLLLLDEVQVGFGRCGPTMAWRAIAPEVEPDAISWAKGMGGGFPIGAFWLSDRAVDASGKSLSSLMGPGSHGTTYGGNPLACAASLAVLAEVTEKNLEANVLRQEQRIRETIASWQSPAITEVRGLGLLLGIGLDVTKFTVPEGKLPAAYLCGKLLEAGLLVPPAGPETIRLLPPLNVSDSEVDEALSIFNATISSLITRHFPMNHLLSIEELTAAQITALLDDAARLKASRGSHEQPLAGQTWAMIFTKSSTRTRVSFEVGIRELGGFPMFLSKNDIQLGRGEPIKDTARVLGRMVHGCIIRTFAQQDVVDFAEFSGIPTINALTDDEHPCQILADLLTVKEALGGWEGRKIAFIGDGFSNMTISWMWAAKKLGFELAVASPAEYQPPASFLEKLNAPNVSVTADPVLAAQGAHVINTDVWLSMGQEGHQEKEEAFGPFQVNADLLAHAAPDHIVLHCLPAYRGKEITEEVLEKHAGIIFQEAENRLHAQKAVLVALAK